MDSCLLGHPWQYMKQKTGLGGDMLHMDPNPRVNVDRPNTRRFSVIWQDGYGYTTRNVKNTCGGEVRYLICVDRFCSATASVRPNGVFNLGRKTHSHPRDEYFERKHCFKRDLKAALLKARSRSIRDIYDEVALLYPQAALSCPYASVEGSMRRWRTLARDDGLPSIDDADVATDDILADANSSDTASVDDHKVGDNVDVLEAAATVGGRPVKEDTDLADDADGAGVACHADPLGVDEPRVVANPADTDTKLVGDMLNMHPNPRVNVDRPRSKRRFNVVWQDGYGYTTINVKITREGEVRYLKCIDRFCRARASVRPNGDFNLRRQTHTHPRDGFAERNDRFKRNLRAAVFKRHDRSLRDIYNEVTSLYPQAALSCPYTTVENSMRRWQAKARDDGLPIIYDADILTDDDLADANSCDTAPVYNDPDANSTDTAPVDDLPDANSFDTALADDFTVADNTDGLAAAATVDNMCPVKDGTDDLTDANSSDTAPVDDFTDAATESTDAVTVNGLEDGAGIACHADPLGVDELLVVANPTATDTTLGRDMLNMDPNLRLGVVGPYGKRFNIVWQDGYGYTTRNIKTGWGGESVRYLMCVHRFCRATASVRSNGGFSLGRRTHTHPRDGFAERNDRFKRNLRAAVLKRHDRSVKDIYDEVTSLYPQAALYCPYTSVDGSMRRWQTKARDHGLPIIDDADVAHIDYLAGENSSEAAPVDDFTDATQSADAVTVNGLEDGAGVACHADPLGVDEPLVVANAAATETILGGDMLNMHPNPRVNVNRPNKRRFSVIWRDGYGYSTRNVKINREGKVRYLICIHRLCRATASVRPNGDFSLGLKTHTHPRDEFAERKNRLRRNLRAAVLKRHNASIRDIYDDVTSLYPQAALYCSYTSVEGSMRRWRTLARDDSRPIIDDADIVTDDDLADANSSDTAPIDDHTYTFADNTDNLAAAATVGGPIKEGTDVSPADDIDDLTDANGVDTAPDDDLPDANSSDTAPVDDLAAAESIDVATVKELAVENGDDVVSQIDPLDVSLATSADEQFVAANPAPTNVLVTSNRHCVICHLNNRTHIFIPCGHYGICDNCAQKLNDSENQQCVVCRRPTQSIIRVVKCWMISVA